MGGFWFYGVFFRGCTVVGLVELLFTAKYTIFEIRERPMNQRNYLIICAPEEVGFLSEMVGKQASFSPVTCEKELDDLAARDISSFDGALVRAELDWPGHSTNDFYGFDVAIALRLRLKLAAPVCMLSFLPKEYFASQPGIKYNVLKARGTAFLRLPAGSGKVAEAFEGIRPLSAATLVYLSNLLVDVRHIIDHFRHAFRMSTSHERIVSALKKIDVLASMGFYPQASELADEVAAAHLRGDQGLFYKRASELLDLLESYRQQAGGASPMEEGPHHTVVVVDDNQEDLDWAASALRNSFKVVPFQSALQAKDYIDKDTGNEIAAIICDWQLLKPGTDEHQEMLGFELLDYAAQKGHYALFSLTSTDDASTLEVDQYLWFEHTLITKDFRHDDALWKMYIPIIRQKIERNRAVIASLPTGEGWTVNSKLAYRKEDGKNIAYKQYFASLKEQYVIKRNSEDWHSFEAAVSGLSDQLWAYYGRALDHPEDRPFLFDLKSQWGIELNRDLKNVLIIRRLFLALWFNKTQLDIAFKVPGKGMVEDPVINIYSVLRHRYFDEVMEEREAGDPQKTYRDLNNAAKVFASQLAIEPNRLPQGILPEENAWLAARGIAVEGGNDNLYYQD